MDFHYNVSSVQKKQAKTLPVLFVIKKILTKKEEDSGNNNLYQKKNEKVYGVEKKLFEFTKIHKDNGTNYAAAVKRILLTSSTRTLLAADVDYHRQRCYMIL